MSESDVSLLVDEEARRRFERGWRQGQPEAIERCLPDAGADCYLATLAELVQIEEYQVRQVYGDHPTPDDYRQRFGTRNR